MINLDQLNTTWKMLDLREWWEKINREDVEFVINNRDKWNYWCFSEDKTWITTLRDWNVVNYKANETDILFNDTSKSIQDFEQKKKSEILTDLFLSPDCWVWNTAEAYEKAAYSDKKIFWFITRWKEKSVIVLDFSWWKKPKTTIYPLNKYNLKMKVIRI